MVLNTKKYVKLLDKAGKIAYLCVKKIIMEVRKDYWEMLRGYRGRWKKNLVSDATWKGDDIDEVIAALNDEESLGGFIGASFLWKDTPEGHDFWEAIANGGKPKVSDYEGRG